MEALQLQRQSSQSTQGLTGQQAPVNMQSTATATAGQQVAPMQQGQLPLQQQPHQQQVSLSSLALVAGDGPAIGALNAGASSAEADDVALLRAELAASDDELAHALQHIAVLQAQQQPQQQQLQQGWGAGSLTAAALQQQGLSGMAAAAQQQHAAAGARPAQPPAGEVQGELEFLRRRVNTLLADNRRLRRAVMVSRLMAEGAAWGAGPEEGGSGGAAGARALRSFGSVLPSGGEAAAESLGLLPVGGPQEQGQTGLQDQKQELGEGKRGHEEQRDGEQQGLLSPPQQQQQHQGDEQQQEDEQKQGKQQQQQQHHQESGEVASLSAELARARCLADSLYEENERLMEISNALRAERDRLAAQLQQTRQQAHVRV